MDFTLTLKHQPLQTHRAPLKKSCKTVQFSSFFNHIFWSDGPSSPTEKVLENLTLLLLWWYKITIFCSFIEPSFFVWNSSILSKFLWYWTFLTECFWLYLKFSCRERAIFHQRKKIQVIQFIPEMLIYKLFLLDEKNHRHF